MAGTSDDRFEFASKGYGKNNVKLLHIRRDGPIHHIQEVEVSTQLELNSTYDYIEGDNRDIVATDTQKNTVYILAKKHGVKTIERFALQLAEHFLMRYSHVIRVKITVQLYPWRRITQEEDDREHNHAFIFSPEATRYCEVEQLRHGKPQVMSGLSGLRVLKTTQSAFVGFHRDEYTTLPDAHDRCFSTVVDAKWWYDRFDDSTMFCRNWAKVKKSILHLFAGPPEEGLFSASVQQTLHLAQKRVLTEIPEISKIYIEMPNRHYFEVDLARFKELGFSGKNNEVFLPVDKPSGNITATLQRSRVSKL